MIYIYMIINTINKKVYIGSTNNINNRFNNHKNELNRSIHHNEHLQNAWNKYGFDSFEFKTLAVCSDSERNNCEQTFMDLYNSQNHDYGYNIRDADAHSLSEETKHKISKSHKGKTLTEKHKQNLSKSLKGRKGYWKNKKFSNEHKQKLSESHKGKKSPNRKNYARIIKSGFNRHKQVYSIIFNGKRIKTSIFPNKLKKWFAENYPDEELIVND